MPNDRFYTPSLLQQCQDVILTDTEFHHLAHVMRIKEGDSIELVNGQGALGYALLDHLEKKRAILKIESVINQKKPMQELVLAQALPRMNRLDFIIEKGTELGATQFWLFPGLHSERKTINEHQIERLRNMSIAAMKQCGRLYLPSIEIKPSLTHWDNVPFPAYFGDLYEIAEPFSQVFKHSESAIFFIGPEAGFSEKEIEDFTRLKVKGVKLHPNILRTDTAALVALSLMSSF